MRPLFCTILAICISVLIAPAHAGECKPGMINPITKISWQCVFPIQIGGVKIYDQKDPDLDRDNPSSPVCVCPSPTLGVPTPGLRVNFWNPAHWIDTTQEPGCLGALGIDIMPETGMLHGDSQTSGAGVQETFAQSHYYIAPAWAMLDLFTDMPCLTSQGFDVAFLSEIDPLYQNQVLSLIAYPETVLFANPAATLSCIADAAVATHAKRTADPLFWCMGSWGTTYPMGGFSGAGDRGVANVHIAGKQIYKMGRLGLLRNSDVSGCYETPAPIWKKSMYKLQAMAPVKQNGCVNIGQSGLLWSSAKAPVQDGNFTWAVFEKIFCCANP